MIGTLDRSTPEQQIAATIDAARGAPERVGELVALLPETLPLYAGRSSAEVTRLRGYLLAALADTGLPADALPYVLEALESGHEPYEVAGAAIALRRYDGPGEEVMPYLERARRNMTGADSIVSFEAYDARWPYTQPTTAVAEVARTIAELEQHPHTQRTPAAISLRPPSRRSLPSQFQATSHSKTSTDARRPSRASSAASPR